VGYKRIFLAKKGRNYTIYFLQVFFGKEIAIYFQIIKSIHV